MPIFGAGQLKLFLLVKRKYTIGNKYFLVKWESTLCAIFFYQYNNLKIFLDSIQSLENPGDCFLVIKDNPDKYDDHQGFLTIGYYLKKSSNCYIDKKK
jgi:hypothetical protein